MTAGTMRPVVCHANPPTGGSFPSEQIQSQHDSTGRAGIGCPTEDRIRDQKVAGSNPVTSTIFDRVCESKSGFFVPLFWSIRTQADMPPFGFNRMTTDKGGLMELRVWFWGVFSVRDVHGQKWVEMSGRDEKEDVTQGVSRPTRLNLPTIIKEIIDVCNLFSNYCMTLFINCCKPPKRLIFHCGLDVQYASRGFRAWSESYGSHQSIYRKNYPNDNTVAKDFF